MTAKILPFKRKPEPKTKLTELEIIWGVLWVAVWAIAKENKIDRLAKFAVRRLEKIAIQK